MPRAVPRSPFAQNSAHACLGYAVLGPVSDTVTVIIGHRFGKAEAVRRLKEGFACTNGHLGGMIAMEQETCQRRYSAPSAKSSLERPAAQQPASECVNRHKGILATQALESCLSRLPIEPYNWR